MCADESCRYCCKASLLLKRWLQDIQLKVYARFVCAASGLCRYWNIHCRQDNGNLQCQEFSYQCWFNCLEKGNVNRKRWVDNLIMVWLSEQSVGIRAMLCNCKLYTVVQWPDDTQAPRNPLREKLNTILDFTTTFTGMRRLHFDEVTQYVEG